jgi:hypothetical protein
VVIHPQRAVPGAQEQQHVGRLRQRGDVEHATGREQLRQQADAGAADSRRQPTYRRPALAQRREQRAVRGRRSLLHADARERCQRGVLALVAGRNSGTTGYSAFPAASPTTTTGTGVISSWTLAIINNAALVNEAQQDSATSYVYSANVGDTDLYNIAPIGVTPASTVAVTTRAFVQKSDAGSRSGKVVLKSGGTARLTAAARPSRRLGGDHMERRCVKSTATDTVDPNCYRVWSAWTAVGVNSLSGADRRRGRPHQPLGPTNSRPRLLPSSGPA